jgi:general secretion pathway protein M
VSPGTLSSSPALASLRQQASIWWSARAPRERQAVTLVVGVLAAFVIWSVLVAPALQTVRDAPTRLDQLEAQFQQMQRVAVETGTLRSTPRVTPSQAAQALKSATDRLGDRAKLSVQGERATLTVTNISAEGLRAWLNEVRSGARARPIEAQLQRGPQGYSGTLGLTLGGTS